MAKFIGCDLIPAIFSWTQTSIVNWGMARNFYPRPSCPTFSYRAILRCDNCLYNRWSWNDIIYSSLIRRKPKHHASCKTVSAGIALCFPLRFSVLLRSQVYSIDPVEGCIVAQCRGRVYRRRVWIFPWLLQFLRETSISIWIPVFTSFVSYYLPQWIGLRVWNIDSSALCTKHTRHIFIPRNAACHNFDSTISCRVL